MKKVAILGTQGVPARYGGFESLVENLLDYTPCDIKYTVFCSRVDYHNITLESYKDAELKYINLHANGKESILYDIISMIKCIKGYDTILILGVSGCMFLPLLRLVSSSKIIVNIDGLEHKRDKWNKYIRKFLLLSERVAVRNSDVVVADNKGIQDYVEKTYNRKAELIAYGGNHVLCNVDKIDEDEILQKYCIAKRSYSFTVCRIEPENNVHIILEAFSKSEEIIVFVGNWNNSAYGKELYNKYSIFENIKMLEPIYDLKILNVFRKNCKCYIHGHSAGGTNPSLVEAMFFGNPIFAFDVIYNKETTGYLARYFKNSEDLKLLLDSFYDSLPIGSSLKKHAEKHYLWEQISKQYTSLF